MVPIVVPTRTRLRVTYSLHAAAQPVSDAWIVLHHGICHSRQHFLPLIEQLNQLGLHAAMIDQQSQNSGFWRNWIGLGQYRDAMAAAVRSIEVETGKPIGCYAVHSMGALIAEETQQAYPSLRRPTVLMAPISVDGALPITLRIMRRRPGDYLRALLLRDIQSLATTPEQTRHLFFDDQTPEEIVVQANQTLKHAPFWVYVQLVLRWLRFPRIRNNGLPKLLLYSDMDEIFHPGEYRKTMSLYSPIERCQIAGGHDFFIQHAAETAAQIARFHLRI